MRILLALIAAAAALASQAHAQGAAKPGGKTLEEMLQTNSAKAVMPVFSQLVLLPFPANFTAANQQADDAQYILELIPSGQTVDAWTQMVTVLGFKGLAARPDVTPRSLFVAVSDEFKKSCPSSFSSLRVFDGKLGGYDAYAEILSCGVSAPGSKMSESAVVALIRGQADYYSVQWAEKAEPSATPVAIKPAQYVQRLAAMQSVKLCARVPGEREPYPSCVGR